MRICRQIHRPHLQVAAGAGAVLFSTLACEPLIAVGWQELLIIIALVAFLIGPLLFKLAKAWIRFQDSMRKKK